MSNLKDGQCGLCKHFGTHHEQQELHQIRITREAPAELTDECSLPRNEAIHLVVTPLSGCESFETAA